MVSGKRKNAHAVAINIQAAKKYQVPKPNELKIYGKALVRAN